MPTATQTTKDDKTKLTIPDDVQKEFPQLVEMIKKSRSMDNDERQYWIDVLPIMSDDQLQNLKDILSNEQKQIHDAEQSYSKGVEGAIRKSELDFDAEAYKEKKRIRLIAERKHEEEEKKREENILKELENL